MRNSIRTALALQASAALIAIAVATGAQAQVMDQAAAADAAPATTGSADIIVTAQRRKESIQNVPIAITAITGQTLKDQN